MTINTEQIRTTAAVLESLAGIASDSFKENYFFKTANQLIEMADAQDEADRGEAVVVRVWADDDEDSDEVTVYVRKRDGNYVGVYIGNNYSKGYYVNESLSPAVVEDLHHPVIWQEW